MSNVVFPHSLISVQFLAEHLSAENLIILDASMKPITTTAPAAPEPSIRIAGALRFDFDDEIRDHNTSLPHMMPTAAFFGDEMQKMGINQTSAVVVYDRVGIFSSPRAWWMFRAMGHEQVAVLDGGLPAWVKAGLPTESHLGEKPRQRGNFVSQPRHGMFVDSKDVMKALNDPGYTVMDARSEGRFNGREPEPREGLRSGHMPNAINVPYANVLENGLIRPYPALRSIFEEYKNKKMIFSCGSGVTACILALAADQAGYKDLAVYDGSWSEWGLPSSGLPVVSR